MKIVQITPGSGDSFYCENCLRDEVLVRELRLQGHEVVLVPLYLPMQTDSVDALTNVPIFFGGVNVYLQQKSALFRKTPRWLDKPFDNRSLLSWASRKSNMTSARDLGETTLSMLRGERGFQVKELDRLVEWIARDPVRPDVVILSNILLGGLAAALQHRLGTKVVCLLQDEESFVDSLADDYGANAWYLLQTCSKHIDAMVAVSRSYKRRIAGQLGLDETRIQVIRMGIDMAAYHPAEGPSENPTIGFLSRACPERGLGVLVDAFIRLKQMPELASCRLEVSGGSSEADAQFLRRIRDRLRDAGVNEDVSFVPDFIGAQRLEWLQKLTVMCVPEQEEAAYGLCAMEALAAGVPAVQPAIGVFPELISLTGGGILVEENSPQSFAEALKPLLIDPGKAHALGRQGRRGMEKHFDVRKTTSELVGLLKKVVGG